MADFDSSLPIRTQNPGDVVTFLADPTTPSQMAAVDSNGSLSTLLKDASGNAITSQANGSQRALDVGINVAGVQIDPRAIRALTSADVVTAAQGAAATLSGAWPVKPTDGTNYQSYTASNEAKVSITQPLPAGSNAIGTVTANQGTNPWVTDLAYLNGAAFAANNSLPTRLTDGTSFYDARQIRALTATDVVTANIKDSSGSAITLGQKAMTASVPVVLASDQSDINIRLKDGAGNAITSQANGSQQALDVGINVAGVQVDPRAIRALTATDVVTANIKDSSGNAFTTSNPLPVSISAAIPGTPISNYVTSSAVAAAASVNHDYTVTAGKTLSLGRVFASASGKLKIEIQVESGVATNVFNTKYVGFNSTANPNIDITVFTPLQVAAGVRVRIIRTNKDNQSQDLYSTIEGSEV